MPMPRSPTWRRALSVPEPPSSSRSRASVRRPRFSSRSHLDRRSLRLRLMPMRVLIVEDEVKMAGLLRRGLQEEGYAVDVAPDRVRGGVGRHREPVRRHRAGRHAPRLRRVHRLPPAARGRPLGTDPDAHRARLGAGPDRRTGRRGRRLPDQALRLHRAAGPPAGPHPAWRRRTSDGAPGRRPDPRPGDQAGRAWAAPRSTSPPRSSRCSSSSSVTPARCSPGRGSSSTSGTSPTTETRTSWTCTCATCGRRWTGRSGADSIETVRGAGYRLRTEAD